MTKFETAPKKQIAFGSEIFFSGDKYKIISTYDDIDDQEIKLKHKSGKIITLSVNWFKTKGYEIITKKPQFIIQTCITLALDLINYKKN